MSKKLNLHGVLGSVATTLTLLTASVSAYADVSASASCFAEILDRHSLYPGSDINGISNCTTIDSMSFTGTASDSAIELLYAPTDIFAVGASADYAVRGDYGNLGVSASSWAGNSQTSPYQIWARTTANANVYAYDTVSVTSDLLAQGDLVTINLSGYFEGTASGHLIDTPEPGGQLHAVTGSYVTSSVQIYEQGTYNAGLIFDFGGCIGFMSPDCEGSFFQPYSTTMEVHVGSTLVIYSSLSAQSVSATDTLPRGFIGVEGQSEASAMNSLTTYLTPTTEGVQLIAQSGHDYTAPVPEPASWAMLLAGLGLVGVATRRRKLAKVCLT